MARDRATEAVVAFVAALRRAGLAVPVGATVTYAGALDALADRGLAGAYWAGRATLVRRPEDVAAYDRVFATWFAAPSPLAVVVDDPAADGPAAGDLAEAEAEVDDDAAASPELTVIDAGAGADDEGDGQPAGRRLWARWSAAERLADKDLAACTPAELDEAHRLMADLRLAASLRPTRRRRTDRRPRPGGAIDLRRTTRDAVRHGGEMGRPATTSPSTKPRRVVLLLDVSGSMAPYARALARFAHAAVAGRRRGQVEVFALGTRLTRITRELATHDPDAALARAAAAVADWDGGTRLGAGLRRFNDEWGVRGVARGAAVVVLSDGWDRGDPDQLGAEVARLRRVAHRLVWVNPLKASPGYEPAARGMAAALPHLDDFVEGHSVSALRDLVAVVARA